MNDARIKDASCVWRSLRHTPVRDLLRGRITCRFDLRRIVERAHLPPRCAGLVLAVTRRTCLWRLEKSDVATELAAHFRDGLDAGASEDALIASFGDVKQAAKLIRRAKVRNRPWVWHAAKRSAQAILVLLLVYASMWAVLILRHPHPSVDYLAKINEAALAVPENDRAWPIYRRAWIDNRIHEINLDELDVPTADGSVRLPVPGEPGWEKVEPYLSRYASLLDATRRGAGKPGLGLVNGLGWEYSDEDRLALFGADRVPATRPRTSNHSERLADESLVYVLLPHLAPLRAMGRLTALDMVRAASRRDGDGVVEDFRTILGLATQSREEPLLINQLVSISLLSLADMTLMQALDRDAATLGDDQIQALAHESAGAAGLTRLDFTGEQYFMLDTIQRIYSDNGRGDGTITYDGLRFLESLTATQDSLAQSGLRDAGLSAGLPAAYVTTASRREMTGQAQRMFALIERDAQRPLWIALHEQSEVDKLLRTWKTSISDRLRYAQLLLLLPALDAVGETAQRARALNEATQVVLALELFHRHEGRYPSTLVELAPRYLPSPPIDHSTGGPLRLKFVAGKPVIYGLGKDGDDDGGMATDDKSWPRVPDDGDWVLYPPPMEPPATAR